MFDDTNVAVRYHAMQMALGMSVLNSHGVVERLSLAEVLNAAAAFELFMLHGESAVS